MMIFCTLYDSNYLDKGIAMYKSLENCTDDFRMYVLAMDNVCERILLDSAYSHIIVVNVDNFCKVMKLEDVRNTRPQGEFCWTCSSYLIDYVLTECKENICTYVDSDLYFFENPQVLIDEMCDKTVQIVRHGFSKIWTEQRIEQESGKFCVQFNTFKKETNAMKLLHWWEEQCKEACPSNAGEGVFGDQWYLNNWDEYDFVDVLKNIGGGVAPWNVHHYKLINENSNHFEIKIGSVKGKIIFFHFHHLLDIDDNTMDICVFQRSWLYDKKLVYRIYAKYIKEIVVIRKMLEKNHGFKRLMKRYLASNNVESVQISQVKKFSYELRNEGLRKFITNRIFNFNNRLKNKFNYKKNIITVDKFIEEWGN